MVELGEHCSMAERRADEAVRDVMSWLKCEYLEDRVGEVFDGVVSGVTGFGLFVEIQEVYADGLVHVSSLQNDYYHFDASGHRLIAEATASSLRVCATGISRRSSRQPRSKRASATCAASARRPRRISSAGGIG